jgi:hypothetical protein
VKPLSRTVARIYRRVKEYGRWGFARFVGFQENLD